VGDAAAGQFSKSDGVFLSAEPRYSTVQTPPTTGYCKFTCYILAEVDDVGRKRVRSNEHRQGKQETGQPV